MIWIWIAAASAQEAPPIVNGETTTGFPAIGGLLTESNGTSELVCTGALIHPRLALTAAHCVQAIEGFVRFGYDASFALGTNLQTPSGVADAVAVVAAAAHPDYDSATLYNDVGVLWLSEDLDADPLPLSEDAPSEAWVGDPLTFVGFGLTEPDGDDAGLKRAVSLPIQELAEDQWIVTYDPSGGNLCSGDSGGPALREVYGGYAIVGVSSFVWWGAGERSCVDGGGAAARIDGHLDWLEGWIAAAEAERLAEADGADGADDTAEGADTGDTEDPGGDLPETREGDAWLPPDEGSSCAGAALGIWLFPLAGLGRRRR